MIRLRWKEMKESPTRELQWMCPFNIEVINGGPRRGELVIIPAPPGMKIKWIPVPVEMVEANEDKDVENFAMQMPEAPKVIVPPGTPRVPDPGKNPLLTKADTPVKVEDAIIVPEKDKPIDRTLPVMDSKEDGDAKDG